MRTLLVTVLFAAATHLSAQQPASSTQPQGSNWQHVQALPTGANIHVKAQNSSASCRVKSVDPDSLTCTGSKDLTFSRTEIKSITIPRRGRSSLIGLAIGAGAGAGIGAATSQCNKNCIVGSRGVGAAAVGVVGGVGGALTGYFTDFAHSTVYKAP